MKKTGIIFSPRYLDHNPKPDHPESPSRLIVIMEELRKSRILETGKCSLVEPKPASVDEVCRSHEFELVQLVRALSESGGGVLDLGDTEVSPESFEVALLAAGGAMEAVNLVMTSKFQNAFALVRPPGHHAGPSYSMGFCIFNNTAIAVTRLLRHFNLNRILILDIDAHHGNGTQEFFYGSDEVLYISLHQDPIEFPGAGFIDEVGESKGLGYTVNIPFPLGIDDEIYSEALDQIVIPIVQQYKPQFIVVSTGFDTHYSDPVAGLSLSASIYPEIFGKLLELASSFCKGRLVAVLEGGYSLRFLGRMAVSVISNMAGLPYSLRDKSPRARLNVRKESREIIREVKNTQSLFWNL